MLFSVKEMLYSLFVIQNSIKVGIRTYFIPWGHGMLALSFSPNLPVGDYLFIVFLNEE